jgi:hypothetical protein
MIMMRPGGILVEAFNINFEKASISINIGNNAFFNIDNDFIFGARSYGYKTIYQKVTYDLDVTLKPLKDQMDTHLFKYDPRGNSKDCFFNGEFDSS